MNKMKKAMTGAAAAALVSLAAATPAEAQYNDRYYDRDRGIDLGDIVTGVAIAGAAAAAIGAISNAARGYGNYGYGTRGYGYDPRGYGHGYDRYGGYGERYAVDGCAYRAQRYGRVTITDVRPYGRRSFRVNGVVDAGYSGGYYDRYSRAERRTFQCNAREDGRVTYFDTDRVRW